MPAIYMTIRIDRAGTVQYCEYMTMKLHSTNYGKVNENYR